MLLGKWTNRFNFLKGRASNLSEKKSWIVVLRQIYTPILYRSETKQIFYSEEFDPGSGWTLATGLTHASRGASDRKLAFDAGDRRTGE